MRKALLPLACISFLMTPARGASVAAAQSPELRRSLQRETTLMIDLLQGYHYSDRSFNELKAAALIDRFVGGLDPSREVFLASDVEFFHRRFDRSLKTVYLFRGDVQPAYEIFDRFVERFNARSPSIVRYLEQGPELEADDAAAPKSGPDAGRPREASAYAESRSSTPAWAPDAATLDRRGERRLRLDILGEMLRGRTREEAIARVREREQERLGQVKAWDAQSVRETFLDSMLASFDAHSGYFSKESSRYFTQSITGSDLGLGLDFTLHKGSLLVSRVVEGGPADVDGRIAAGDRLLAVRAEAGEWKDASAWTQRDVFAALQGKQGERVTLRLAGVQSPTPMEIELAYTRHERIEGHASGTLVSIPSSPGSETIKVGLITLPAFYVNPDAEGGPASTSSDVQELLRKLKEQGAQAIVLDLRTNGGGVMNEAVKTAGLFISKGPLFFSRGLDRKVTTMADEDPAVEWAGPLVVLVSGNSASASEAFSGALQWHGRALIAGSEHTFGKGSAQDYIDMGTLSGGALSQRQDSWGTLRLTRMLFYFPGGQSPQLSGVRSDIVLPVYWRDRARTLEADLPNALPNETVPAVAGAPDPGEGVCRLTPSLIQRLRGLSEARVAGLPEFELAERSGAAWRAIDELDRLPARGQDWLGEARAREAAQSAAFRAWMDFDDTAAYPQSEVVLASVAGVCERHAQAVRKPAAAQIPRLGRTVGGVHYLEFKGRVIDADLRSLDYTARMDDAEALAQAWASATGQPASAAAVRRVLTRLRLAMVDEEPQPDITGLLAAEFGASADTTIQAVGARAFMDKLVQLERWIVREHALLDVRRRESLRIAADWVREGAVSP